MEFEAYALGFFYASVCTSLSPAEAGKLPTADARLALDELEPIEAQVAEAEAALTDAEALRGDWSTAVAATLGWMDPARPTGGAVLPPGHPLTYFNRPVP